MIILSVRGPGGVVDRFRKCHGIDYEISVFGSADVGHGGPPAFMAHSAKTTGTGAGSRLRFEGYVLGHDGEGVVFGMRRWKFTKPSAGGAV